MRDLKFCAQCNRQRKDEHEGNWFCPFIRRIVCLDTDAESCEGFMLPFGHDRMWDNHEKIVLDI